MRVQTGRRRQAQALGAARQGSRQPGAALTSVLHIITQLLSGRTCAAGSTGQHRRQAPQRHTHTHTHSYTHIHTTCAHTCMHTRHGQAPRPANAPAPTQQAWTHHGQPHDGVVPAPPAPPNAARRGRLQLAGRQVALGHARVGCHCHCGSANGTGVGRQQGTEAAAARPAAPASRNAATGVLAAGAPCPRPPQQTANITHQHHPPPPPPQLVVFPPAAPHR